MLYSLEDSSMIPIGSRLRAGDKVIPIRHHDILKKDKPVIVAFTVDIEHERTILYVRTSEDGCNTGYYARRFILQRATKCKVLL